MSDIELVDLDNAKKQAKSPITSTLPEGISWEGYVRSEVTALLDIYLPESVTGVVGIKYVNPVITTYENGHKVYDKKWSEGVQIILEFKFAEKILTPIEPPKI